MELENLSGSIIGVISEEYRDVELSGTVETIVMKKTNDALKMVGLNEAYLDKNFEDLSNRDKNKIRLASKLNEKVIILINFSKGLTNKDIDYFKKLFKRIVSYGRKIILVDKNSELFLNCVDKLYVINNDLVAEFDSIFDSGLDEFIDVPKIVEFNQVSLKKGVKLNEYKELDDLLKAIYRIKS